MKGLKKTVLQKIRIGGPPFKISPPPFYQRKKPWEIFKNKREKWSKGKKFFFPERKKKNFPKISKFAKKTFNVQKKKRFFFH